MIFTVKGTFSKVIEYKLIIYTYIIKKPYKWRASPGELAFDHWKWRDTLSGQK